MTIEIIRDNTFEGDKAQPIHPEEWQEITINENQTTFLLSVSNYDEYIFIFQETAFLEFNNDLLETENVSVSDIGTNMRFAYGGHAVYTFIGQFLHFKIHTLPAKTITLNTTSTPIKLYKNILKSL